MIGKIKIFRPDFFENLYFPALDVKVKAGGYGTFESAALDFPEDTIDLTRLLIKDKETVFFAKVSGDSLSGIGIFDGNLLVIQKGMLPVENDIIVVFLNDEYYVKKYKPSYKRNSSELNEIRLKSENPAYNDLYADENSEFFYWGLVTSNINMFR
ncbi:peptidase S24 [Elizabethkingia anophelis]|nr:peptidase S24 [Elizabethkingia anophelis]